MIDVIKILLLMSEYLVNLARVAALLLPQNANELAGLLNTLTQSLFTFITSCFAAFAFVCSQSTGYSLAVLATCWLLVFPFAFVMKGKDGHMLVLYKSYEDLLKDKRPNVKKKNMAWNSLLWLIQFNLTYNFIFNLTCFYTFPDWPGSLIGQFEIKSRIALLLLYGALYLFKKSLFLKIPGRIIITIWNGALGKQWDSKAFLGGQRSMAFSRGAFGTSDGAGNSYYHHEVYKWHDVLDDDCRKEEVSSDKVDLILQILRDKGIQLKDLKGMKPGNLKKLLTNGEKTCAGSKIDRKTGEEGLAAQSSVNILKPLLKDRRMKANFFKTEPLDLKFDDDYAKIIRKNILGFCDEFNINCKVGEIAASASFYLVHLQLGQGTRLESLYKVKDDISYYLDASVFFEVLNRKLFLHVRRKDQIVIEAGHVYFNSKMHKPLDVLLGLTLQGKTYSFNLSEAPHMMIAGTTGSGKSVLIHSVINSMFITTPANILRFMLIDPKQIEFGVYDALPHLISPVITDADKIVDHLSWLVDEMNERYTILKNSRCRNVEEYNEKSSEKIPYLVLVVDELGDIMMREDGKKAEKKLVTLAQKSRAAGIHMILATQRPSAAVFTGLLKANIPCRVSCRVSSNMESRIIMDRPGAEDLIGNGDTLFWSSGMKDPIRLHCPYIKTASIESCAAFQNRNYRGARDEQR